MGQIKNIKLHIVTDIKVAYPPRNCNCLYKISTMPRLYVGKIDSRVRERDIERLFDGYGRIEDILMKAGYAFVDIDDRRDAEDAVYDLNGKDLFGERVSIEFAKGFERGVGGRPLCGGGRRRGEDDRRDRDRDRDRDRGRRDRGYDRRDRDRSRSRSRSRSRDRGGRDNVVSMRKQHARDKYGPPVRTKWQVRVENLSSRVSWQDLKDYVRPHGEVTYADAHRQEQGVAVLCFASKSDLDKVMEKMNGTEMSGKKITIIDETEKSREKSRDRSRSRNRSRSRSRSKSRSRSRSRSKSKSRSRSKSKSKSRDRSRS